MITFASTWYRRKMSFLIVAIHIVLANLSAFDRRRDTSSLISSSAQYRSFIASNLFPNKYIKGTNILESNNEGNVENMNEMNNSMQYSGISYAPLLQYHHLAHYFSKHKDSDQNSSSIKKDEQFHMWPADISNSISSLNELLTPSYIAVPPPPNSFLSGAAVKKIIPNMIALLSTFSPYTSQQPPSLEATVENGEALHSIISTPPSTIVKRQREQYAPCTPPSSTSIQQHITNSFTGTTALNAIKHFNRIHSQTVTIQDLTPEQLQYFHKDIRRQQEKTTKSLATFRITASQTQPRPKKSSIEQTACSFISSLNPTLQPFEASPTPYPSPILPPTQNLTKSNVISKTATNYLKAIPAPIFEPHVRKAIESGK